MKPSVGKNLRCAVKACAVALTLLTSSVVLADADFDRIPQEPLEEWSGGKFIPPNEPLYSTFAVANEGRKGALIAVGSFRALAAASQGDFEYAILMDVDSELVEFNRKQIEFLKTSDNVEQFLAAIEEYERPSLGWQMPDPKRVYFRKSYVGELRGLSKFDESTTFLTNPTRFARLKKLAVEGKILAIPGNLAGKATLIQIGRWLRARGAAVGALDLSNAQGYFVDDKVHLRQFIENLSSLPWRSEAVVNFTEERALYFSHEEELNYRIYQAGGFEWAYFSLAHSQFIGAMKEFESSTKSINNSYSSYLRNLKYTSADLHHQAYLQRKKRPFKCEAIFR